MIDLISRASTGKLKVVKFDHTFDNGIYTIHRYSGSYKGKLIKQPDIVIDKGKSKRTVEQQFELQLNHLIKEKLDKGYILLEGPLEGYTEEELNAMVGNIVKNMDGIPKPMLAKAYTDIKNKKTFDKNYWVSRKIDGLRCLVYQDDKGELHTASRGGMNYDAALVEILTNPTLIEIFNTHPNLIMDTEAYRHGMSLQQIGHIARTQVKANDYSVLQLYWYDIVMPDVPFEKRMEIMNEISTKYNFTFNPEREFNSNEPRIQLVPHELVSGLDNIMKLHDQYVLEGFEGAVGRLEGSVYKPNSRTNNWIKFKAYKDCEATIIGYTLGARGSEDICFRCILDNGKDFLAKVYGDREQKEWYYRNFGTECLEKKAIVKYFYLSDDGVPLQPGIKGIRIKEDI